MIARRVVILAQRESKSAFAKDFIGRICAPLCKPTYNPVYLCQRRKSPPNPDKAPMKTVSVSEPFTFRALDYMGPLSETARSNKYILVVMDHFTKWCEAFPTKDQKVSTVANCLISKVFSRFGPPLVLHSDQGSNFESIFMHEICNIMGIAKTRTTAYHPCGDGQVERQNRTLQDMLAHSVSNNADDWDIWLDLVLFAYNTSKHESTGFAPGTRVWCDNWKSKYSSGVRTER